MVDALASDRSYQPFGEAVLPRRARGDGLVTDAHGSQSARDGSAVDPIPITDQVARGFRPRECFCDLTCNPFRARIGCDVDKFSALQSNDNKDIEQVEANGRGNEQIHSGNVGTAIILLTLISILLFYAIEMLEKRFAHGRRSGLRTLTEARSFGAPVRVRVDRRHLPAGSHGRPRRMHAGALVLIGATVLLMHNDPRRPIFYTFAALLGCRDRRTVRLGRAPANTNNTAGAAIRR